MNTGRVTDSRIWPAVLLAAVIIAGVVVIGLKYQPAPGIEISIAPERPRQGNIYVGGEVNNPGFYPLHDGDTLESIIASAGGLKDGAGLEQVSLVVAGADAAQPQKININRAEAWLLEALPGVGEARADAIIEYRRQRGLFHDIYELASVPGLGEAIFQNIKDLITVAD